ncbi:MAG: cytochrome c biogenesis protein CcsA [Promethearchaeota archaeon]
MNKIDDRIILILFFLTTIINYFFVYIYVNPFTGFIVSGRPIFYMVPFAFSSYLCFGIVLMSAILYLKTKNIKYDLILLSSTQIGVVVGAITICIGMIWAKVEWGYFWQWEARETATLIMWLAYTALLVFREMIEEQDHEKKAVLSAVFGILVSPSIPLSNFVVGALHPEPQRTELSTGIDLILMFNFFYIGTITLILIFITFRVNKLDLKLKEIRKIKMEIT